MSGLPNPLRFRDDAEERRYYERQLVALPTLQLACLASGVIYYMFFVFDQSLDPSVGTLSQILRGLVLAPVIWIGTSLSFFSSLRRYVEVIALVTILIVTVGDGLILLRISGGLSKGIPEIILLFLFAMAFIRFRLPYYIAYYSLSFVVVALGNFIQEGLLNSTVIATDLCLMSSVFICMFAVVTREMEQRQQYLDRLNLDESRQKVEDLLNAFVAPQDLQRIRNCKAGATKIVISYRRSDSEAIAGRIRDRLIAHFGAESVFMDIDNIPFGIDFRTHIHNTLSKSNVVLAVIGPNWLGANTDGSRRIMEFTDPIRVEVEAALQTRALVLPVLVGDAKMPTGSELPESLLPLAYRNAIEIHAGRDFNHHIERLVRCIDTTIGR